MSTTTTPPSQSAPETTTSQTPDPSAQLDLAITVLLFSWPALNLAVQSNWGGPTSAEKRECLCGEISDLLTTRPETDAEDLEEIFIQYMNDEYDVVIDDESAAEVAGKLATVRAEITKGKFDGVRQMWEDYQAKIAKGGIGASAEGVFRKIETGDDDDDDEGESGDEEDWEDEGDVEMTDAAATTRAPREKVEPEVDEDGFTKVAGKKKR